MSREKKRKIDSESVIEVESDSEEMQERGPQLLEFSVGKSKSHLYRCAFSTDDKTTNIV